MKKLMLITVAVLMMAGLAACAAGTPTPPTGAPNGTMPAMPETIEATTEVATVEPTATTAPTDTPAPTATPVTVKLTSYPPSCARRNPITIPPPATLRPAVPRRPARR